MCSRFGSFELPHLKDQMRTQLKVKVQNWKNTALAATKSRRLLQARLRRSQQRVLMLEQKVSELKVGAAPTPVCGHTYPAQLIALAIFIVTHANGSLRCAAKTVGFVAQLLGWNFGTPSPTSVRRWVMRCGHFKLQQAAQLSGNYVALLDESIQIGREKLLLLLGVKIEADRSHCQPLCIDEVTVLGLEVQSSWTGEEVADFLTRTLNRLPQINIIHFITDGGKNLAKALSFKGFDAVSDCTHILMNAVKKLLGTDSVLCQLHADVGQLRRRLILTEFGYLLPPSLRDKDRFIRIFTLGKWMDRIDRWWPKLSEAARQHLAFVEQARPRVQCMNELRAVVERAAAVLKGKGLSAATRRQWDDYVGQCRQNPDRAPEVDILLDTITKYFDKHAELIARHGRLLCCTDIIESIFGRYKNKGGTPTISADVLAVPLYSVTITPQFVQQALSATPYKIVHEWEKLRICENRYAQLRRMEQELKSVAA